MAIALVGLYIKGGRHAVLAFANGRLFHNLAGFETGHIIYLFI